MRTSQVTSVVCRVRELSPTPPNPPGTATPNCLNSLTIFTCEAATVAKTPIVVGRFHTMPARMIRYFSPDAVRADNKEELL